MKLLYNLININVYSNQLYILNIVLDNHKNANGKKDKKYQPIIAKELKV